MVDVVVFRIIRLYLGLAIEFTVDIFTCYVLFFFSSRRRHTRLQGDWSSDVCSSDLTADERLGHPVALSRVLLNLTTNALKFTDRGYVEVVTRETGAARVEFSVRDSGRGIDPALLHTLYRPLRPAGAASGRVFSQTGLGLATCRRLVEAMASELKVESRAGWGTRFFFELDLPPCPPPQALGRRGLLRAVP